MKEVKIIHIDPVFLVVNKPGGLLAVSGRGPDKQDCVVNRVKENFSRLHSPTGSASTGYVYIGHHAACQNQGSPPDALHAVCRTGGRKKEYIASPFLNLSPINHSQFA